MRYDRATAVLEVLFPNGTLYRYYLVPPQSAALKWSILDRISSTTRRSSGSAPGAMGILLTYYENLLIGRRIGQRVLYRSLLQSHHPFELAKFVNEFWNGR